MHEVILYHLCDSTAECHSQEGKPILFISFTSHLGIHYFLLSQT